MEGMLMGLKFSTFGAALAAGVMMFAGQAALADTDCDKADAFVFSNDLGARTAEALTLSESCMTIDRSNGLWMKGITLEKMGKYQDAVAAYDAMLTMEPKFSAGWSQRGGGKYMPKK